MSAATTRDSGPAETVVDFDALYADSASFVWRVVRRLGVAASDADDVTQDVFIVALRRLADFEGRSSARTWLYGIAVRCVSQYRRRAHRRRETPQAQPDVGSAAPSQLEDLDRRRARELLDTILSSLDADKRAVFVAYEIESLAMAEVASALGCPLQTAYSRLRAARQHIEAAVARARAMEENR